MRYLLAIIAIGLTACASQPERRIAQTPSYLANCLEKVGGDSCVIRGANNNEMCLATPIDNIYGEFVRVDIRCWKTF